MFVDYDHFVIPTEKHAGDWAFLEHGKVVEVKMEDLSMEEQKKAQVSFSSLDVHTEMTGFHRISPFVFDHHVHGKNLPDSFQSLTL